MPLLRSAALLLTVLTVLAVAGAGSTGAATARATGAPAGDTSVSVFLRAPHPLALERLASQPVPAGPARAARLRELARLVPSPERRARVVAALRAEGMSITSTGTWSISATAPAAVVAARFGVASGTGELTSLPAVAGLVSGVYLTTGGPAAYRDLRTGALDGADIRNADAAAGVRPSAGAQDAGLTIATLQLASFKATDLTAYATSHGIADPVAAGRYAAVTIDGGPAGNDTSGGDVEVALDQESILSSSPTATQQAYFAPNTNAGFADVFDAVYDDVVGSKAGSMPDPHILAMSVSWGACETLTGAHAITVLEPIISSVVAAGVTIFSAAGDDGIYDCGSRNGKGTDNHQADVDYPASSPEVVAVGGSRLSAMASKPNGGSNWTEKAWSCAGAAACAGADGTGGGGGGASGSAFGVRTHGVTSRFRGFPKPLWQDKTLLTKPFAAVTTRMLPDVVADADPVSGFEVTSSDPQFQAETDGGSGVVGGTSLASPLSAAQLTNTLADAGRTTGVGDIHGALYSAYLATRGQVASQRTKAFRDVVSGTNGAHTDRGKDPSISAGRGFDTTSGLGGVLWPALVPYLLETHGPSVTGHVTHTHHTVTISWGTSRGQDLMVPAATLVEVLRRGRSQPLATYSTVSGRKSLHVPSGTYTVIVAAWDIARQVTKRTITITVG